jgi:phenylacetic acid degradation operon negative regulatory protein
MIIGVTIPGVNARRFVLDLLSAAPSGELRLDQISRGAVVMGVGPTAVRVALTRLTTEGRVFRVRRGVYQVATGQGGVAAVVRDWRAREACVVRWSGAWVGVLEADSTDVKGGLDRGLLEGLLGLRRLREGTALYVRPDNLQGGVDGMRRRVGALCEGAAPHVFGMMDLSARDLEWCKGAYACGSLDAHYEEGRRELERVRRGFEHRPVEEAAGEAFVRGGAAISLLLRDPLVPASWIDGAARRRYFAEVRRFDRVGRSLWTSVLGLSEPRGSRAPAELQARVEGAWP